MNLNLTSPNYSYLSLSPNSDVLAQDKSCIIFAPNGAGKTTIYKTLLENNPNEAMGFTYDVGDPTYKRIEQKTKKILIDPTPVKYIEVHERLQALEKELAAKERIKKVYSTTRSDLPKLPNAFREAYNQNRLLEVSPLSEKQRASLRPLLSNQGDLEKALKEKETLICLNEEQKEIEAQLLFQSDIARAFSLVDLRKHKEEIDEKGCPFCGRKDEPGKVYEDMLQRQKQLTVERIVRFKDYRFVNDIADPKELLSAIDETVATLAGLTDEQALTLYFTNGDQGQEKELQKKVEAFEILKTKEQELIAERDALFAAMKEAYSYVAEGFAESYPGCSASLGENVIEITTNRAPNTYSDGEKHEMYSRIIQLTMIGSNRPYLLVDDPLTELDAANEYKIFFRLAELATEKEKKVIIFTCNANLVNLATKQTGEKFNLYYLESRKTDEGNVEARLMKLDFGPIERGKPYLTLENFCPSDESVEANISKIVSERARLMLMKEKERSPEQKALLKEYSPLLHYDSPYSSNTLSITNGQIADFVTNFEINEEMNFRKMAETKIALVAAMRVFVERRLYEYDEARSQKGFKKVLETSPGGKNKTLTQKIVAVDKATDYPPKDFFPNWNRKTLMQLKTMLNDGDHPFGLIQPLFFALSIGWDDYQRDLAKIKNLLS